MNSLRPQDSEQENQEKAQSLQWQRPRGAGVGSGREGALLQFTQLQPKAVGESEKLVKPDRLGLKSQVSLTRNLNSPVSLP